MKDLREISWGVTQAGQLAQNSVGWVRGCVVMVIFAYFLFFLLSSPILFTFLGEGIVLLDIELNARVQECCRSSGTAVARNVHM